MADTHPMEEEAVLYLLGRLGAAERRRFETQLEQSAELRALVRELEDGAVALAMAAPQHPAPAQAWRRIEEIVTEETSSQERTPSWWWAALRNGWAAAAACLAGWLLYALWFNHAAMSPPPPQIPSASRPHNEVLSSDSTSADAAASVPSARVATNLTIVRPEAGPGMNLLARTGEIVTLRRQITELERQVTQLTQALAQQQTLLSEPGRLTMFQLAPPTADARPVSVPSPDVQRALFLALARQLGWLQGTDAGVDFVDFSAHPETNETAATTNPQLKAGTSTGDGGGIPGFVLETNMFLAIGSTLIPAGGNFTVWSGSQPLGTVTFAGNPTVVTFPTPTASGGWPISVTSGLTNIGQWTPTGSAPR